MRRQTATVSRIGCWKRQKKKTMKKENDREKNRRISLIFCSTTLTDCGQRIYKLTLTYLATDGDGVGGALDGADER